MGQIWIVCPARVVTGGPELLHQLCYQLRHIGYDAVMFYYEVSGVVQGNPVPERYQIYKNPYIVQGEATVDDVVVIPETVPLLMPQFQRAHIAFWWLSVDNYYGALAVQVFNEQVQQLEIADVLQRALKFSAWLHQPGFVHLVQSEYAYQHCRDIGIQENKIYYLSDYLRSVFLKEAGNYSMCEKQNIVLFNPSKGYEFTQKLIASAKDIDWIPLVNLTPEEMSNLLMHAKVYIDFGNHPGKDRIPREAAISGCCVITGKRGSAVFNKDVPIPDSFKFDDRDENIELILSKIRTVFDNYADNYVKFELYRQRIRSERAKFESDVARVFGQIARHCQRNIGDSFDTQGSNLLMQMARKKLKLK